MHQALRGSHRAGGNVAGNPLGLQLIPWSPVATSAANSRIAVTSPGCYAFALNATSLTGPVLTVSGPAAGGNDPDVLAYARTLAGERSIVVVLNNQRTEVDLGLVAGGGIDVSGLLTDGTVSDLTGSGVGLQVAGGRLRGVLPALTAVVL